MTADPWLLAVLPHTVSTPNKRQEPGWANPPALVWQGDAIRSTDVPDVHAGPITQAGPCWNTWRCTRWTTTRQPPTSSKGAHGGPCGMPRTPGAPRPKRPATRRAGRRRPERPRGLAVQHNKDQSPRDGPPAPPLWAPLGAGSPPSMAQHTQETWLLQRTQRQCRSGTADSRGGAADDALWLLSWNLRHGLDPPDWSPRDTLRRGRWPADCTDKDHLITGMLPREGGFAIMLQETGIATRAQEMHVAAALRDRRYTPFFSSRLAETGATSTWRGGGLLTAVSSKYVAEHEVLSFTEIVPGKVAALEIRTDGGGLTLINVHGPQAGCSPLAGRAAFWADIQMYAMAHSLGGRHPVVIAGDTNIYMEATTNLATENFREGWEACGFRRATAGGVEDMTPTLHPSRHRPDTFLVNEPLLPWSLWESVWTRGMAHPQVVGSDHLPVRLALPGFLNAAGHGAMPNPYGHTGGRLLQYNAETAPVQRCMWAAVTAAHNEPSLAPWLGPAEQQAYGSMPAAMVDKVFEHLHAAHDALARVVERRQPSSVGTDLAGGDPPESGKRLQAAILCYDTLAACALAAYQADVARHGTRSEAALWVPE